MCLHRLVRSRGVNHFKYVLVIRLFKEWILVECNVGNSSRSVLVIFNGGSAACWGYSLVIVI